jgi:hypothetical protein
VEEAMSTHKREVPAILSLLLFSCVALGQNAPKGSTPDAKSAPTGSPVVHQGVAITLKVTDFEVARQKAISSAAAHGGKVADTKVNVTPKGLKNGWIRIEVPADQLSAVLPDVYGLGKLYGDRMLTSDKTSEFESLARRMDQLGKHQQRLSTVLEQPRRMRGSDILYLQERLFRAGVDQEDLAQARVDMSRRAGSANVILTMFEPEPIKVAPKLPHTVGEHIGATFSDAWISFQKFGLRVIADLAFLLVYAVIWIPIGFASWILGKKIWRRVRPFFFPPDHPLSPPPTPA